MKKYAYSGWGTPIDRKCSGISNNDFARNFIIFGADNSSTYHTENLKNGFLILVEGDTYGIKSAEAI